MEGLTLGRHLAGARLGWHPLGEVGMVRVSSLPRGQWLLDILAPADLPRRPAKDAGEHVAWWAFDEPEEERERMAEALLKVIHDAFGPIRLRKGRLRLIVNDEGRRLRAG